MSILVTGGAGFIGSNFILNWFSHSNEPVLNLDKLTYAGYTGNLISLSSRSNYQFVQGNIGDVALVKALFLAHKPRAVINFAAESHVDRSIETPIQFIQTNLVDTFYLLEAAKQYWGTLVGCEKENFRFIHVSTDEVYGSLEQQAAASDENSPYKPNSPYAASKAGGDHLVRAYHQTYGLPTIVTHASNNYGPYQFPEKLIPLMIHRALMGQSLPIYGDGQNVRDWLYVLDHCEALECILEKGLVGEVYNIGGNNQQSNVTVVNTLCTLLDDLHPRADKQSYGRQIFFVKDRLGHDRRYALDASKLKHTLGWAPQEAFDSGICKTVQWYLTHADWLHDVKARSEEFNALSSYA